MTDRLTDDDIKRGLELAEAATPGPWFYSKAGDFVCTSQLMDGDIVCRPPRVACDMSFAVWSENRVYIVDACNHYPAALRELTQLRAEVARLTEWKESAMSVMNNTQAQWERCGKPGKLGQGTSEAMADEVLRLTAELDATPPTLEWLRLEYGGQPEIMTGSTGYETYRWSCGVRFHSAHNRVTGNTGLTLPTRAAVRAHVEAMKGAK
jgi:hypothetical protein